MNIKTIVKVMNFHSLIRVDNARKKAEKYMQLEKEVNDIINMVVNNRNFILDKKLLQVNKTNKQLNIYIGSDFGFCAGINYQVNQLLDNDKDSEKIIIGKKLRTSGEVLLKLSREDFTKEMKNIEDILYTSVKNNLNSSINIIYNHFYNTSHIELKTKKIFPIEIDVNSKDKYKEDYYVESDITTLLINLVSTYLTYEVKIAEVNSYASENITRQNTTSESLKKLDEKQEQDKLIIRKEKTQKEFSKVIDTYTKKMGLKGDNNESR